MRGRGAGQEGGAGPGEGKVSVVWCWSPGGYRQGG